MAIKIMITDDHSMIREGLKNLLELDGDIEVIAEAIDGEDCLEKLETVKPDVLLLDINMPKMSGIEFVLVVIGAATLTSWLFKAVDVLEGRR